jgi:hypothetical protein
VSSYETNIWKVENSNFAIGDHATAEGSFSNRDRDDMAGTLRGLLAIVSKYGDPVADEVRDLTLAASREMGSGKPEREVFRRLAEATRKLMEKLGPGVIEVGALADAVAKISDMIRHW